MTTIDELKAMHESEDHVEFKAARHNYPFNGGSHTDPRKRRRCVLGYMAALANERGGMLVLGMEDDFPHKVCGSDFALNETGALTDAIYEALRIRVNAYELYENKNRVLVIEVPSRPVGRLLKFEGVALMRTGESLREMSDTEMLSILSEQEPDYSAKICNGLTIDDLDKEAVNRLKRQYATKQQNSNFLTEPISQILSDLDLMRDGKLTIAALILLGCHEAIKKYLPQDEIIIEYRLNETSIPYTARQEYQEPLLLAIDKVWNYINQPASNPLQHVSDGPYIFDIPAFNEEVIREAVLNAVSHRSMQIKSSVVIRQSPKSISIINAGGFPIGVDIYNILTTPSVPRAKLLCEVLQKTGLIERSGQGVDKIYYNCLEEGKALPDYTHSDPYQVYLTLKGNIVDPAFHLFIDEEQTSRDEEHKLSVFHLIQLYKIKEGDCEGLDRELVEQLIAQGLVVKENDELRLCDKYQSKAAVIAKSRNGNLLQDEVASKLGVKLGVIKFLSQNITIEDIENKSNALFKQVINKLGVNSMEELGVKLGVNRKSILLLLYLTTGLKRKTMADILDISLTSIDNNINKLKEFKLLKREGSDKNGSWKVTV